VEFAFPRHASAFRCLADYVAYCYPGTCVRMVRQVVGRFEWYLPLTLSIYSRPITFTQAPRFQYLRNKGRTVNHHMSWRLLIHCWWTSHTEQSANTATRVGHYTRTISTSTQNSSDSCCAEWQKCFRARCTYWLTYLFTYTKNAGFTVYST